MDSTTLDVSARGLEAATSVATETVTVKATDPLSKVVGAEVEAETETRHSDEIDHLFTEGRRVKRR